MLNFEFSLKIIILRLLISLQKVFLKLNQFKCSTNNIISAKFTQKSSKNNIQHISSRLDTFIAKY